MMRRTSMSKDRDTPLAKPSDLDGSQMLWTTGLSLIHPFFGEEKRFEIQWNHWASLPEPMRQRLDIIVVDDHGTPPIHDLITPEMKESINFNLSVYRILDNLKWSTPCALNLGLMAASTAWTLIMDSDCLFEEEELTKLLNLKPRRDTCYKFARNRITENEQWSQNIRYLPCTMLQHKDMFLEINGFDEDFVGTWSNGYGFFDNHFDGKQWDIGRRQVYLDTVIATEYMDDMVGERVGRSTDDMKVNRRLMYQKWKGEVPNSQKMLRFNWARRFHHREF
jgi:hypothetical protein